MATNFPEWTEHGVLIEDMKQRILHMHAGSGAPSSAHEEASLSMVMQAGSSLVNLLRDRNVTALIVPNDIYACRIYALFQMLGLSVPQDISIVSFDNSTFMRSYPIATIDRGYTHIAYCAVHLCIGDIPVQTDAFRRLYAKCRLIDRGSMDKPRHRRLQF